MTRLHYPNKVTGTCWPPQIPFSCKICSFFQSFSLFILASFTRSSFYLDTMKRVQRVWKPRSRCLSRHWLVGWLLCAWVAGALRILWRGAGAQATLAGLSAHSSAPWTCGNISGAKGVMVLSLSLRCPSSRTPHFSQPFLYLKIPQRRVPVISYTAWSRCTPSHGCVGVFVTSLRL